MIRSKQSEQTTTDELRQVFTDLVGQWTMETGGMSSVCQIVSNRHHLRLIALGSQIVPLILEDLKDRVRLWFPALQALTGRYDIGRGEGMPGKFRLIANAWLEWGQKEGLI